MKRTVLKLFCLLAILGSTSKSVRASDDDSIGKVRVWEETITLPSYFMNPSEECPMFFQHQSYQGASRVAYPYPQNDKLSMEKGEKEYTGLFLENEYIKLCLLPELGGRLFYATDKTNGYEIFYRQHVIKPMLIGMLGAWVSGGVEFCVFHHHRASTNMPLEYRLEENEDGSATIWIGEFEPRHRMRWNIGISLYPGRSWVQANGNLINASENMNSMLYWSNVAVHVNDGYQILFPPSTQYAAYHAKNSFSHWPVTTEPYTNNDFYEDSIDVSWYKNNLHQNSFFAHDIDVGNLGGYDWEKHAGTMYVANHHISKGAKLWQWGTNSTFDRKALTDDDGPYAELMVGAYSDNQPDYSWIAPYEVKQFEQTWYPLRETEGMKFGNMDATVNLELREGGKIFIAANTTMRFEDVRVVLENAGEVIYEKTIDIDPATPFKNEMKAKDEAREENLKLKLMSKDDREIISYQPVIVPYNSELPPKVVPPGPPEEYESNELLYYAGERIYQFHNARLEAEDYFLEALRRDPLDVRCNTAMGIISQENMDFDSAKFYYRKAISRLTDNWTRPRDCEPLYHLGVILKHEGKFKAAIDTLYRSVWDYKFRSASYFKLAEIYAIQEDYDAALEAVQNSLVVNGYNMNALKLKTSLLRLTGQTGAAVKTALKILEIDHLSYYAYNELEMMYEDSAALKCGETLNHLLRGYPENYLELSSSYLAGGLYNEAIAVLEKALHSSRETVNSYPSVHYYLGYLHHLKGNSEKAEKYFTSGSRSPIKYCFPFRVESMKVYNTALKYNEKDSRACYFMGNLLYDRQAEVAIGWWEKAVEYEPGLAMAFRNLGWGYQQALGKSDRAIEAYQKAIETDPSQPRFYYELDILLEDAGAPILDRLELLSSNHAYVSSLQPAIMREILVLVLAGEYDRAIELMDGRIYYREEDVNVLHDIHVDAHLLKGKQILKSSNWEAALREFRVADTYPENQMIERPLRYNRNSRIYYYTALAYQAGGDSKSANKYFEIASSCDDIDQEFLYYKAMALENLGRKNEAEKIFADMIQLGRKQMEDAGGVDFFAKFGEGLTDDQRKGISCHIMGLGYLGMGDSEKANEYLSQALEYDVNQLWARIYLEDISEKY